MCTRNMEIVSVKVIMQVCSYNDQNIVKIKMYELIENENLKKINGWKSNSWILYTRKVQKNKKSFCKCVLIDPNISKIKMYKSS